MKNILLLLLPALVAWHDPAPAQGIHFEQDSFSVLLAKAKRDHKAVFIDCYTTWCGPCKWMEKNIFPNDTAGNYYNSHFICASFDMEKGEGIDLKKRYDVRCYPTYLYIDEDGNLLHRVSSTCSVREFVAHGETAFSPNNYATLDAAYRKGNAPPEILRGYIGVRQGSCLPSDSVLATYTATQPESAYMAQENWNVLRLYVRDPACTLFRALIANTSAYEAKYTADSVQQIILKIYGGALSSCLYPKLDSAQYMSLRAEIVAQQLPYMEQAVLGNDMGFYQQAGQWKQYAHASFTYLQLYADSNWLIMNNICWAIYENIDDTLILDSALTWIQKSIAIYESYYNTDTYAALLYKLGRKEDALRACERALILAEQEKIEAPGTKELLVKIKAMK